MPKVTVALITYNRTQYLKKAIDSIISQTYLDFELLIMDNGSTSETYELVKPYLNEQIKYHRNPINDRRYMNQAFTLASGKYIIITHDDDMMMPTMLEKEVDILENNSNCVLVGCNAKLINETDTVFCERTYNNRINKTFQQYEYVKSFLKNDLIFICPTVMLRKSFLDENNLNLKFELVGPAADNYLWFEINMHNVELTFISEPLYYYRVHSNQDGRINAHTMELTLLPKTIDLLKLNMSAIEAKPYIKLVIIKSAFDSAYAYKLKKIKKDEYTRNMNTYKSVLTELNMISISDRCILFFMQNFHPLYIILQSIYVRIKKL